MPAFALLRHSRNLVRTVLAGFLLTLTCAIAAPVLSPQSTMMVCTSSGDVKLVAVGSVQAEETPVAVHHTLVCVLCLGPSAPPPELSADRLAKVLSPGPVVDRLAQADAVHATTTPPARGPPVAP